MADTRESFPTLEGSSQEGLALRAAVEGDSPTSKNGSIGFSFKDSTGNVVLPQLDSAGRIKIVSGTGATGNGKKARGTASGNASLVTVASLTLTVNKVYDNLDFIVSCFRDALFQVILSDNAAETVIADALCSPGMTSFHGALKEAEISTGATGTQLLLIKAQNMNALSDFRAALSVNEN